MLQPLEKAQQQLTPKPPHLLQIGSLAVEPVKEEQQQACDDAEDHDPVPGAPVQLNGLLELLVAPCDVICSIQGVVVQLLNHLSLLHDCS